MDKSVAAMLEVGTPTCFFFRRIPVILQGRVPVRDRRVGPNKNGLS